AAGGLASLLPPWRSADAPGAVAGASSPARLSALANDRTEFGCGFPGIARHLRKVGASGSLGAEHHASPRGGPYSGKGRGILRDFPATWDLARSAIFQAGQPGFCGSSRRPAASNHPAPPRHSLPDAQVHRIEGSILSGGVDLDRLAYLRQNFLGSGRGQLRMIAIAAQVQLDHVLDSPRS